MFPVPRGGSNHHIQPSANVKRKDFIENVRCQLTQRRTELFDGVSGENSLLNSLSAKSESGDSADLAANSLTGEISARLADVEFREIAKIDKALRRINDNCYGVCEGCKKNIPLARLEAIPHASFCVDCKRISEEHGIEEGSESDWAAIFDVTYPTNPDASVS